MKVKMKVNNVQIFVMNWIEPIHDKMFIDMFKHDMSINLEENFDAYMDGVCKYSFPFHKIERRGQSLVVKNLREDTPVAIICSRNDLPVSPSGKRWTKEEVRLVKRCYPLMKKWPHLLRVLKTRTWEEIEKKGLECNYN
jgi:hypothetical protein